MSNSHFLPKRRHFLQMAALSMGALAVGQVDAQILPPEKASSVPSPKKPSLAVVLGSGSARGFAHIGVIRALEAEGLRPDLIVGCSAGSLVGAFWAAGYTGAQMEELALTVKDADVIDFAASGKRGLVVGDSLEQFITKGIGKKKIEQLLIPYAAVATLLRTGEMAVLKEGDLGFAVRASCSMPGVFIPARRGEEDFVDGGLVSPIPVGMARSLGADVVVAVDVSSAPANVVPNGIFEQVMQSFDIMGRSLARLEADRADILIRPDIGRYSGADFTARNAFIQAGLQSAKRMVPVIQERLAKGPGKRRS